MIETTDPLSSKQYLSAARSPATSPRPYSPNGASPLSPSSSSRTDALIRALRSKCQSLADGGTKFHAVFDQLDARDSGELSSANAVLSALKDLNIPNATKADADSLIKAFEGSTPGKMSYRKFLRAVMLGQSAALQKRTAAILEKLQWQIASSAGAGGDYDPSDVFETYLAGGDDDGVGSLDRNEFRSCFTAACATLQVRGMEESDLRRVMDRYDRDGDERVCYVDFVKALRFASSAGNNEQSRSPSRNSSSDAPLRDRVRERVAANNLDAFMLRENFLPRDVMGPGETCITFSEVETVMAVDLGLTLSAQDELEIMNDFGVSAESVDAKAMLSAWELWEDDEQPKPRQNQQRQQQQQRPLQQSSKSSAAAAPPTSSSNPNSNRTAPSMVVPNLPFAAAGIDTGSRSYSAPVPNQPQRNPVKGGRPNANANANNDNDDYDGGDVERLRQENEKLKSELSAFDLNFFEEIEDLKHNYERLKRASAAAAGSSSAGVPLQATYSSSNSPSNYDVDPRYGDTYASAAGGPYDAADPFDSAPPKQMRDMIDRADRVVEGGVDVVLSPRQAARFRKSSKSSKSSKSKKGGKENTYGNDWDFWNSKGGVVGAHERKLAWQIAGGGTEALKEVEKWMRRLNRNGDSYLAGKQVAAAMREGGYDLSDSDVQVILEGFGCDEFGRVDVNEFIQALHDIAAGNEWYYKDGQIPSGARGIAERQSSSSTGPYNNHAPLAGNPGEFMHGTAHAFNGLQAGYEGKWDEFDASREPSLVEAALKEVLEQMSLIDVSRLPGYGSGNRAAAILRPFKKCDRKSRGIISISDFSASIEALGLVLTAGEIRALGHHFSVPDNDRGSRSPTRGGAPPSVGVEYSPFVRFLLEASTVNRWSGGGANDWEGKDGLESGNGWWGQLPKFASKCRKVYKKEGKKKSKWLKSLKSKLKACDEQNGNVSQKTFSKILSNADINASSSDLEDLAQLIGDPSDHSINWKLFFAVFDSGDGDESGDDDKRHSKKGKKKDSDSSSSSDSDSDGDSSSSSKASGSSSASNSLMQLFMELMTEQSDPRVWLNSVCVMFSEADEDGNGYLDGEEFYKATKKVGMKLSRKEFGLLVADLDEDNDGRVSYIEIISKLLKMVKGGGGKGDRPSVFDDEREIAEKILDAMGENPGARRRWLSQLRKHFFGLDKFRNGTMSGPKLIHVLKELEVKLTKSEDARLLDILATESSEGGSGGVSYRELLRFCSAHSSKWYEYDTALAERLRAALRDNMRKSSFVANLKKQFEELDEDDDGIITRKEFDRGCRKLGMELDSSDSAKLLELLDVDGSGSVSYEDFVAFFNNKSGAGGSHWWDEEVEIAKKLKDAVSKSKKGADSVFAFRDECAGSDDDKVGAVSPSDFRKHILRTTKVKLSEKEVSKLSTALDSRGHGLIPYRPVVSYLISCLQPLSVRYPDEYKVLHNALSKVQSGKRGAISSVEERCKVADKDGNGRISVKAFHAVLAKCGIKVEVAVVETLGSGIDEFGDGGVNYGHFLDELKGSHSYGREEWYEREASLAQRLRKEIWSSNKKEGKGGKWQKQLRASFEKFDRDGDGVVSHSDFTKAMSNLSIKVSRSETDRLMEILDKNGEGLVSYSDFVDFMVRSESDHGDHHDDKDESGDDSDNSRGRSQTRKGGGKGSYKTVVGDYSDRLSPRAASQGRNKSKSRSPQRDDDSDDDSLAHLLRKALLHPDGKRAEPRTASDFKHNFGKTDKNKNGMISTSAFKKVLQDMGPVKLSKDQWDGLLEKVGDSKTGNVDYGEFVKFLFAGGENRPFVKGTKISSGKEREVDGSTKELLRLRKKILTVLDEKSGGSAGRSRIKSVFKEMDVGDRGNVSCREFQQGLKRVGVALQHEELETLFSRFDSDDDGLFNYADFLSYLLNPEKRDTHKRTELDDYYGSDNDSGDRPPSRSRPQTATSNKFAGSSSSSSSRRSPGGRPETAGRTQGGRRNGDDMAVTGSKKDFSSRTGKRRDEDESSEASEDFRKGPKSKK